MYKLKHRKKIQYLLHVIEQWHREDFCLPGLGFLIGVDFLSNSHEACYPVEESSPNTEQVQCFGDFS